MKVTKQRLQEMDLDRNVSIHNVFSWSFFTMQIFGFMPLQGVFSTKLSDVNFKWRSFRSVYAILTNVGLLFMLVTQVARIFMFRVEMADVHRLWYFGKAWFISIFFIYLAKNWKEFSGKWNSVDAALIKFGKADFVKRKLMGILLFYNIIFIGDYLLIQLQRIYQDISHKEIALTLNTWNYFQKRRRFQYIYQIFPYDFFSGICLLVMQLFVLIAGTFLDIFIIGISLSLAGRMKLITKRIKQLSTYNNVPVEVWTHIREGYNNLELLCEYVNSKIGWAIMMSFLGNLGIILIQLFNNLKATDSVMQKAYLYYSFFFLLSKLVGVCIYGSKIHDESRKPLVYLYRIEDAAFNTEIKRLILQISRDNMALSGMDFFHLRRNMLLKIAGSIVTYELVVIQFAGDFLKEQQSGNRTTSI